MKQTPPPTPLPHTWGGENEERVTWAEVHEFFAQTSAHPMIRESGLEIVVGQHKAECSLLDYVTKEHPPRTRAEWEAAEAEYRNYRAKCDAEWEGEI